MSNQNFKLFVNMQKLVMLASVLTLALSAAPDVSAQWVQTAVPQGDGGLCFASLGTMLFVGTGHAIYCSTDSGVSWNMTSNGLPSNGVFGINVTALTSTGTNLLAGTFENGAFRSTDSGSSWIGVGWPSDNVASFAVIGNDILAGSYQGNITISTNGGTSWTPSDSGLSANGICFGIGGQNIFAGTGSNFGYGGVYLSTDTGRTWSLISTGALSGSYVTSIVAEKSELFASTFNGNGVLGGNIFLSTDNGTNWIVENNGLSSGPQVNALNVTDTNLFAGIYYEGVYLSTNDGTRWQAVNTGLGDLMVRSLCVFGGILFAGTDSGVWCRPLSEMIGISSVAPNPSTQSGFTAYPNPFAQSTTIDFTSPENGAAEITIVNLLDGEVARIYSGELNVGEHSFTWDASAMPSGTYWCEIRMNGTSDQIPIVVQR